jgi:polyisoprenyl-teichoic acid--peptidoglycan teichoic acid transferase
VIKRLLATTLALSAWIGGTVLGSVGTAHPASGAPLFVVGRAHATYEPALGGDPIWVLVLGSDARPGEQMDHSRADSIHILGINPTEHRATLFGIPRDSYVPLSTGGTNKINAAMAGGGPEAEIATVENLTGLTFDYYVLTGFGGFMDAVDDIGGLVVNVPYDVTGYWQTYPAGPHRLDGTGALDLVRTRHSLPLGDFNRSMDQGWAMLSALTQFRSEYAADEGRLFTWLGAALRNVQTSVPLDELMHLAFLGAQIPPKNVTNLVATGHTGSAGGSSVVYLSESNQPLFQDIGADGYILTKDIPASSRPDPT